MLLELTIRNIALIEKLTVAFAPGLNVLTGETGAGKSIVVDAMNLSLGGRADRDLIRTGADKASVQAVFDARGDTRVLALIDELGLEAEDGLLTLSRELGGRSLCRVCGTVVPLSQLKQIAASLVELHGQHEHQELLSPARHMELLDAYGGEDHAKLLDGVRVRHAAYTQKKRETEALARGLADRELKMEDLARRVKEIDELHIKPGEDAALEKQVRVMGNAEKLATNVKRAYKLVYQGGGRAVSAQESLQGAMGAMEAVAEYDERYETLRARLQELYYTARDVGYELQSLAEELDFDPGALDKAVSRLDTLERAKRRYGPELTDIIATRDRAKEELSRMERGDEELSERRGECEALKAALTEACAAVTASRRALADAFADAVVRQLRDLGMEKTRFQARIDRAETGERGCDAVEFYLSPNPGEPLKPLSSTASGGELSRVMLSIKTVMADRDRIGAMIFDEVDAGISGRAAQAVGERMAGIATYRQIIAVSHLPQIAALADAQYAVEKTVENGRTGSSVRLLDEEGRARELSRMVGGAGGEESALGYAWSLLAEANAKKQAMRGKS